MVVLAGCSTTGHLPEGELLYIGQKSMTVQNESKTPVGLTAMEEVNAALAKSPNNAFFGSSSVRTPLPIGLWIYNGFAGSTGKFGRWMLNHFASEPVLLSAVNPAIRAQAARNVLREYGYFNARVTYDTLLSKRDSLKVKLQYHVDMANPYQIDTVLYKGFSPRSLELIRASRRRTLLPSGSQFNVVQMDAERTRISDLLRNRGCYYFRPDYLIFQADTTLVPNGHVSLRLTPVPGMPAAAEKPFKLGNQQVRFLSNGVMAPFDSLDYEGLKIYYQQKLPVRPNMLKRWVTYQNFRMKRQVTDTTGMRRSLLRISDDLYSLHRQERVQERLADIGIFRYIEMQYQPRDTAALNDTLDLNINLMMDKPWNVELDFNAKLKSNNQMGPGATATLSRHNVFGGGETWNVVLGGYYEWQIGKNRSSSMDSYEAELSTGLVFPHIVFPRLGKVEYDFPATTTFQLYANMLRRPKYYNLLAFGGSATYDFQPTTTLKHSITPFRLTFNVLTHQTDEFLQYALENPGIRVSLSDLFIPAMQYTVTYSTPARTASRNVTKHSVWWQSSVTAAGNVVSAFYKMAGRSFSEKEKEMLGVPFAQFIKLNSELRSHYDFSAGRTLAARLAAGAIWSYGNSTTAPYTEQFFVGGANSVRSFTARGLGPGGTYLDDDKYAYLFRVGDLRLEANLEYRFKLVGNLRGAPARKRAVSRRALQAEKPGPSVGLGHGGRTALRHGIPGLSHRPGYGTAPTLRYRPVGLL